MFLQLAGLWLLREPTTLLTLRPQARHPRADRTLTLQGQGCPCRCKISILAYHSSRAICFKSIKSGTPTNSASKAEITWGCRGPPWVGTPLLLAVFWRHSCTSSATRGTSSPRTNLEVEAKVWRSPTNVWIGSSGETAPPPAPRIPFVTCPHPIHQRIIPFSSTSHL